ncbi:MAG TPA: HAMP domain-containing sensor histidine kinase [Desulfitobacteriaceae bacterium]|nr:HAMP domain-containing sensor histidine kinase [Desulfitobacteriaceae bacterium]
MNLKRRLMLVNASTVVIPVLITALIALACLFIFGQFLGTNLSIENYQRLLQIKFELINSENSILKQIPEAVAEENFQKYWQERLAEINGEILIIKDERVIFSSGDFTKIEVAKLLEVGNKKNGNEQVYVSNISYLVQSIALMFKDGSQGSVLLLAPVDRSAAYLSSFLIIIGVIFSLSLLGTNIVVSYQFSRTIIEPLKNLQKAAEEIRRGNLDYQIGEEGDLEIQELCRDLELMRIKLKNLIHTQLKYEDNRKMLVSSISHDLKTPVTSIKGYVEGIIDGVADNPEKMERYLKTIYLKAQQVDQMIDDLLLYSRLDLKQIPFNFEKTDIAEYLKDCVSESEPELANSNIKITLFNELQQKQEVFIDRERMKRVIMNILDNSRKYMNKAQGEIITFLRETNASIIIELRDNGSGISKSELPHIFDRFYRSDAVGSEIKGSGLGLSIAKQIIEGHQGRIWAVSHGDQGVSIMISLSKARG